MRPDQCHRVDVRMIGVQDRTPVQARCWRTVAGLIRQVPDELARPHGAARLPDPRHWLVRRSQTTVVSQAHHRTSSHLADERDHAVGGGQHALSGLSGQIGAPVPGEPAARGRLESAYHRRTWGQWPQPPELRGRSGRAVLLRLATDWPGVSLHNSWGWMRRAGRARRSPGITRGGHLASNDQPRHEHHQEPVHAPTAS